MKYKISINKPCQENWNSMSPTQQGAFCAVCKKDVVDFTNLPVGQFKNKLKNTTCGRFTAQQLEQVYDFSDSSRFSRIAAAIGITTILAGTSVSNAQSPIIKRELQEINNNASINHNDVFSKKPIDTLVLKGRVIDVSGEGVFGALVELKETQWKTRTDFNGYYSLQVPKDYLIENGVLIIRSTGYGVNEIKLTNIDISTKVITLSTSTISAALGGITVYKIRRTFLVDCLTYSEKKKIGTKISKKMNS